MCLCTADSSGGSPGKRQMGIRLPRVFGFWDPSGVEVRGASGATHRHQQVDGWEDLCLEEFVSWVGGYTTLMFPCPTTPQTSLFFSLSDVCDLFHVYKALACAVFFCCCVNSIRKGRQYLCVCVCVKQERYKHAINRLGGVDGKRWEKSWEKRWTKMLSDAVKLCWTLVNDSLCKYKAKKKKKRLKRKIHFKNIWDWKRIFRWAKFGKYYN